jgi:yopX protein
MRPRYRVWDKEEKKMIYDAENTYDGYPVSYVTSFGGILKCPDFFDVMQYTGIKDVNSNRIYEKDIVSFCTLNGTELIGEVKYYEDGASFLIIAKGRYAEYLNNVCDLEVLGNTHQNKELLDD